MIEPSTKRAAQTPITIVEARPDSVDAVQLITELDAYLAGHPYPQESRHAFSIDKLVRESVAFFVMRQGDIPMGCGALKCLAGSMARSNECMCAPLIAD